MKSLKRTLWLAALGLGLYALAQQVFYPPNFGPYEALRQQAHAQCQGHLQQGNLTQAGQAYALCLQQVAASPYVCLQGMDFFSFQACVAAATAGYPAPGKAVLTRPAYRVEIRGRETGAGPAHGPGPAGEARLSKAPLHPGAHLARSLPGGELRRARGP
ncbi:hypothetical protein [Thermus thermophilus]|uniref:Uncharacterized protein n=1 Tax=Thermus thermophilus TaxID=274 RepID=A0A7R7TFZ5_THETH|nr:hypothetical protein [Thermus thermophilus]BCP67458.1 hypothetical protein TthHB5018_b23920 [Thermus thermophilus]